MLGKKGIVAMYQELIKREQENLRQLLKLFDEKLDKIPNITQRLNTTSTFEPTRSFRLSMKLRFDLIKSISQLYHEKCLDKAGIDWILICQVGDLINHN